MRGRQGAVNKEKQWNYRAGPSVQKRFVYWGLEWPGMGKPKEEGKDATFL